MSKKIIFYEFFLFWQLNQVLDVYCDNQSEDFKKYMINSLNHICVQNGWDFIQQTEIILDNLFINTKSVTSEIVDESNFIQKLYYITLLLNCEYTNVMQTFNVMLSLILKKCEVKYLNKQYDQLGYCTRQIIYIVKYSTDMFKKLRTAAKYLDKIDLRIIDSPIFNIKTVDNEINYFYIYAKDLKYPLNTIYSSIVNSFESIKYFNKKAELMISNLYNKRKVCGTEHKSSISADLLIKYNIDQMEKLIEDSDDYINIINKDLKFYFSEIIENCYLKLGFEQLQGTYSFKYIHSKTKMYDVFDGIVLCNHFISHPGWMSLEHIFVKTEYTNEKSIYFKDIICTVDKDNYYFVRSCLSLILRCRYIEIFRDFNIMLGYIVYVCKYENEINCAVKLYEILMKSDDIFKKMLFALNTLRYYKEDKKYGDKELLMEKLLEIFIDFLNDVRKKYFSPLLFINNGFYEAQSFLKEVAHIQSSDLQKKLKEVSQYNMNYCTIIKCESDISLITTFEQLIKTNTLTESSNIYSSLCDYLDLFFQNVLINDYVNLGFDNLPQ